MFYDDFELVPFGVFVQFRVFFCKLQKESIFFMAFLNKIIYELSVRNIFFNTTSNVHRVFLTTVSSQ